VDSRCAVLPQLGHRMAAEPAHPGPGRDVRRHHTILRVSVHATVEVVILLLAAILSIATVARRFAIPYPILLTVGGLFLGLLPGLPEVVLAPDLVLLLVLPPLLWAAAWDTTWRDFKAHRRAIALLALGLVLATVASVAAVAHAIVGLDWPAAFALGAIVSPTDALAATTVMQRLHAPRRLVAIVEGESLVNDSSGLIAYRFAVAAALTGRFSLTSAAAQFVLVAVGGVLVGVAVGYVAINVLARLDDRPVEILAGVVAAYAAYLLAELIGVSGVLACVSGGLLGSRLAPRLVRSSTRLDAYAFWETLEFLLNGLVFMLLGFQARGIWMEISDVPTPRLVLYGVVVPLTVIATRLIWVFPAAWLPRAVSRRLRERDPWPGWRALVTIGWAGMRGAVSLALALALPRDGVSFPDRSLVLYLTFCVILFTLVGQGLTLAPLLRALGYAGDGRDPGEELEARRTTARAGLARVGAAARHGRAPRGPLPRPAPVAHTPRARGRGGRRRRRRRIRRGRRARAPAAPARGRRRRAARAHPPQEHGRDRRRRVPAARAGPRPRGAADVIAGRRRSGSRGQIPAPPTSSSSASRRPVPTGGHASVRRKPDSWRHSISWMRAASMAA
jgi:monovalent cation/hydrogen antiporter